ncbi:DNA polymerase B region [Pyrolobus fumarii 1A]|uniref:DNA polymerase n=1 Tax=Pyrolobus fumarii (strain DSM 11204 / 1A) TaxID=694429 RepID=G0ECK3_PYRF1|nr:DNA-directed DNA polymerase I [Pyrolobus fumarii]AEM39573.1 DNA polymerase B region [Pyrolobus fumarii 1A]
MARQSTLLEFLNASKRAKRAAGAGGSSPKGTRDTSRKEGGENREKRGEDRNLLEMLLSELNKKRVSAIIEDKAQKEGRDAAEVEERKPEQKRLEIHESVAREVSVEARVEGDETSKSGVEDGAAQDGKEEAKPVILGKHVFRPTRVSDKPLVKRPKRVLNTRGYILGVYYDGEEGKAYTKIVDENGEVVVVYDVYGHKPYFLTDLPPDKVRSIREIITHPSFDHLETVERMDLLLWRKVTMTKIVVKDPNAVRVLREKVPKAWEANIKYHHNYIYDLQLIPGMPYIVEAGKYKLAYKTGEEEAKKVYEIFADEDEETRRLAVDWIPLFEAPPPKPRMLALDIEVYTPFKGRIPDSNKAAYPVISVAFASNDGLRKVMILARPGLRFGEPTANYPADAEIEIFDSEVALILETIRLINNYEVVITFNGDNFDFPYLHNRAVKLGIPKSILPFRHTRDYISLHYGFHVDLYKLFSIKALQSYAFGSAYKEFTLDAISEALLGEHKIPVETSISDLTASELAAYNFRDAMLTLKLLTFNNYLVWKLVILLMRISKLPLEDVTRSQVSAWIRNLFYWEHRRRGLLIPRKEDLRLLKGEQKSAAVIKGRKYAGAIVLDAPAGVFFNVVVLDFASLYPSIIKKWNLSYETVNPEHCPGGKLVEVPDVGHRVCMSVRGITAQIVGLLRDFRVRVYKKKAKDKSLSEEERHWYDVVQAAMKVYINASYGVFGAENFPLYAPSVAESVTAIGRYTIKQTVRKAADLGLKVLYGDTDSLFLWAPSEDKLQELQRFVEENFGLELEVDKVYRFVAFSGRKKNYIGVYPDGKVEVKGVVAKKRNAPMFLKKAFGEVLELLGQASTPEEFLVVKKKIRDKLHEVYKRLKEKDFMLDELAIHMALTKPVNEYANIPPHVRAAIQLMQAGVHVMPGDVIVFVKVRSKDKVKAIQLAKLHEVDTDEYIKTVRTAFEQVLGAIGMSWDDIVGSTKLEAFFARRF